MNHFAFIFAAYSVAFIGIIGLTGTIFWRKHALIKKIALLESRAEQQKPNKSELSTKTKKVIMMGNHTQQSRRLFLFFPFVIFIIFAVIVLIRMSANDLDNRNFLPNALAGQQAPQTQLPLLTMPQEENNNGLFDPVQFKGRVTLVNFWGSWCPPCRDEHPQLLALSKDKRFDLVGVNFKDNAENARRFLGTFGNPFKLIGFDPRGRAAIDWGVYGPPETFIVNSQGKIIYKHIGPIMPDNLIKTLLPEIEKALQ